MIRVVLDTNVIVSAFLTPAGKPASVLQSVLRHDLDICFDTAILAEYEEVLSRPKFAGSVHRPSIERFIELLSGIGIKITCIPSHFHLPDEKDRKFYDAAVAAGAFLITGNKRHFPDENFIFEPAGFLLEKMQ